MAKKGRDAGKPKAPENGPGGNVIGENLRRLIEIRRYSQGDFAESIGLTQGMVSRWVRGKSMPSLLQGAEMARVLQVSLDLLVDPKASTLDAESLLQRAELGRAVAIIGEEEAMRRILGVKDLGDTAVDVEILSRAPKSAGRKGRGIVG